MNESAAAIRGEQPFMVRAWYGLPAEIRVGRLWHWIRAGRLPLPHPGVVDLHLRQGIPRRERDRLTYWHELGHLETLPLALLHALALWLAGRRREDTPCPLRLLIGIVIWLAGWELAAEGYTMGRAGQDYARLYRNARPPLPMAALFWGGMSSIMIVGTLWIFGGRGGANRCSGDHRR